MVLATCSSFYPAPPTVPSASLLFYILSRGPFPKTHVRKYLGHRSPEKQGLRPGDSPRFHTVCTRTAPRHTVPSPRSAVTGAETQNPQPEPGGGGGRGPSRDQLQEAHPPCPRRPHNQAGKPKSSSFNSPQTPGTGLITDRFPHFRPHFQLPTRRPQPPPCTRSSSSPATSPGFPAHSLQPRLPVLWGPLHLKLCFSPLCPGVSTKGRCWWLAPSCRLGSSSPASPLQGACPWLHGGARSQGPAWLAPEISL